MWPIIKRIIRDRKKSIFAFCAISVALLWMLVAMYPSMAEKSGDFQTLVDSYPEGFLKAFGVDGEMALFDTVESFISLEYYSLMWPLVAIILGISLGTWTIAGEVDAGTMELMLSLPVSRMKQYVAKYLAGVLLVVIFTVVTVFSIIPMAWVHGITLNYGAHYAIFAVGGAFSIAVFSLSMMFSSFFSERGKASSILSGIMVVMYALHLVASLKENLENLQYLSFFYYFDYSSALRDNSVDLVHVMGFLGVAVVGFVVGLVSFTRRDVAV